MRRSRWGGDPVNAGVKQVTPSKMNVLRGVTREWRRTPAKVVMSAADPKRTFLQFVEAKHFPDEFVTSIQNSDVPSGKVNIALSELPNFTALPFRERVSRLDPASGRRVHQPEHRLHRARLRRCQARADLQTPVSRHDLSVHDRSRYGAARTARRVLFRAIRAVRSGVVAGTFGRLRAGHPVTNLARRLSRFIDDYAPNIRQCIVGMQVISPKDIEAIAGITGGNIFHVSCYYARSSSRVPCRNGQISGPRSKAITLGRAAHIPEGCDGRRGCWRRRRY